MIGKKRGCYTTCAFRLVKQKRGISSVVATVGLLLLTIVIVAVLIAFIVPFVRNNLDESTACLDYSEYFNFNEKFNFNCYNQNGTQKLYMLSVGAKTVENLTSEKVEGFKLVFYGDDMSITKDVTGGDSPVTSDGGIYMFNKTNEEIKIPKPGETRTYVYNTTGAFSKVEVYVNLKSKEVCPDVSDSVKIWRCS